MNTKATFLSVSLTAAALLSGLVWYELVAQNKNVPAKASNAASNNPSGSGALEALSPGATPPPVPWASLSNAKNVPINSAQEPGHIIEKGKENSVLITPSPPPELSGTVSGNDSAQIAERRLSNKSAEAVSQVPVQVGSASRAVTQVPVQAGPPLVRHVSVIEHHRTYVRHLVVVREHSGKVHLGRAVKHVLGFSLRLPFRL